MRKKETKIKKQDKRNIEKKMKPVFPLIVLFMIINNNIPQVSTEGETTFNTEFPQSTNMFNNITLESFDRSTKEKDIMLILFYVPW